MRISDTLSKIRVGPRETFLPPNDGEGGFMLAQGPEGGIEGLCIDDSFHLLSAWLAMLALCIYDSFTFILIL